MRTTDYIDALRTHTSTGTDYAVAKLLGITPDAVYKYTKQNRSMDNTTAARVAALLGIASIEVIADMEIERARDDETRAYWKHIRKEAGRRAAAVLMALYAATLSFYPGDNATASMRSTALGVPLASGFGSGLIDRTNNYTQRRLRILRRLSRAIREQARRASQFARTAGGGPWRLHRRMGQHPTP